MDGHRQAWGCRALLSLLWLIALCVFASLAVANPMLAQNISSIHAHGRTAKVPRVCVEYCIQHSCGVLTKHLSSLLHHPAPSLHCAAAGCGDELDAQRRWWRARAAQGGCKLPHRTACTQPHRRSHDTLRRHSNPQDHTGSIKAAVHPLVIKQQASLGAGATLALRQVGYYDTTG
jgi:hypothetical protein